jgi:hypothetical protein
MYWHYSGNNQVGYQEFIKSDQVDDHGNGNPGEFCMVVVLGITFGSFVALFQWVANPNGCSTP